jgi:hypothetical protein
MTEIPEAAPAAKPQRRMLLLLVGLFFVPLAASFILYYAVGWRPSGGSNHGELLQPIRQLPADAKPLLDKWALVYVGDGNCATEDCRHALWVARQARTLLNQEASRVNRALLATTGCCDLEFLKKEHDGIKVYDVTEPASRDELVALLPPGDHAHDLFIVDPRGNIVMRFDTRQDPKGLLEDLKKLLKLSHIG